MSSTPAPEPVLEAISFYTGRLYYNYVGVLGRLLKSAGLDRLITPGMGHILFALVQQDDQIISELSERTQLSNSTLTGMLQRMERSGLIRRRTDKRDRRAVRIRLTAKGRALQPRCEAVVAQMEAIFQEQMSLAAVTEFRQSARTMIENLRRQLMTEVASGAAVAGDNQ